MEIEAKKGKKPLERAIRREDSSAEQKKFQDFLSTYKPQLNQIIDFVMNGKTVYISNKDYVLVYG